MSDSGDLELDAEGDPNKGSNSQAVRKNISIKLKGSPKGRGKGRRGSARKRPAKKIVEEEDPMEPDPEEEEEISSSAIPTTKFTISDEPVHKSKPLKWDHKVLLIGEKVVDPTMYCCERCGLPILVYGRMLPCKHVFCFDCARKNDKACPRCNDPVQRVEQSALGTVYVCTYGASKHDPTGCRRTYLSQRDLQAHVMHRHTSRAGKAATAQSAASASQVKPAVSQSTTSHDPFKVAISNSAPLPVTTTTSHMVPAKSLTHGFDTIYQRHTAPPPSIPTHVPPPSLPMVSQPPPPLPIQNPPPMQGGPPMQGMPSLQSHTPLLTLPPTNQPPPQTHPQLPPMNQPPPQSHPPPMQNPSHPPPMQSQPPPPMTGTGVRQPHSSGPGHLDNYHSIQSVVPRKTNLITVPIQDEGDYRKHEQGGYHSAPPSGGYQTQHNYPPPPSHPPTTGPPPVSYSGPPPRFSMPPPHTAGPNMRPPISHAGPPQRPGGPPVNSHAGMPQGPPRFYEDHPRTPPYNQQGGHSPRPWGGGPRGPRGPAPRGNYY